MKTYLLLSVKAWKEAQGEDTLTTVMIRARDMDEAARRFVDMYPPVLKKALHKDGIVITEMRPEVLQSKTVWDTVTEERD